MRKITEQLSEKEANQQISKKVFSANIRTKRIMNAGKATKNHPANIHYCGECGFRVRGAGHLEGSHHTLGTAK